MLLLLANSPDVYIDTGSLRFRTPERRRFYVRDPLIAGTQQQTAIGRFQGATMAAGEQHGITLRRGGRDQHLRVVVSSTSLAIVRKLPGQPGSFLATATIPTIGTDVEHWVIGRTSNGANTIVAEYWTTDPFSGAGSPVATLTHTLTGADIDMFGMSVGGASGVYINHPSTWASLKLKEFRNYASGYDQTLVAHVTITNDGQADGPAVITITGPVARPRILNGSSRGNRVIYFSGLTLAAGDVLKIDTDLHTAVLNGTTDVYPLADFAASNWWEINPGKNLIRLFGDTYQPAAQLSVAWRAARI